MTRKTRTKVPCTPAGVKVYLWKVKNRLLQALSPTIDIEAQTRLKVKILFKIQQGLFRVNNVPVALHLTQIGKIANFWTKFHLSKAEILNLTRIH